MLDGSLYTIVYHLFVDFLRKRKTLEEAWQERLCRDNVINPLIFRGVISPFDLSENQLILRRGG